VHPAARSRTTRTPPSPLRGVVFDLDGTLLDTLDDIRITLNRTLVAAGWPERGRDEIARAVGDGAKTLVARAMRVPIDDARVEPMLAKYVVEYEADPTPATKTMPGAIALLDLLEGRGVRVGIVTNKPRGVVDRVLARALPRRFDVVIAAGDVARLKPEPDPILAALARMGVAPSEAMMVGDGAPDVIAARAAGVFSIGCTFGYGDEKLRAAKPDATIDHLDEVVALLR
jgi:phosphoglycolate phosphatase